MMTLLLRPDNSPFIPVPLIADLQNLALDSRLKVIPGNGTDCRFPMPMNVLRPCGTSRRLWEETSSQLNIPSRLFGLKKRGEGIQSVLGDRRAHAGHQFLVVVQIVTSKKHGSEDFFGHHEVMNVSA